MACPGDDGQIVLNTLHNNGSNIKSLPKPSNLETVGWRS